MLNSSSMKTIIQLSREDSPNKILMLNDRRVVDFVGNTHTGAHICNSVRMRQNRAVDINFFLLG